MYAYFDYLPLELMFNILEYLDDKELFMVEAVNSKWQKCVKILLSRKKILKSLDYYSRKFLDQHHHHSKVKKYIINDDNIDIIKNIFKKCPNIREIDLSNTKVIGKNNFIAIGNSCAKLEAIHFNRSKIEVSEHEMEEFGKTTGSQLIKCSFDYCDNLMLATIKHLKNIEELSFTSSNWKIIKRIFHDLNYNCNNLKVLQWKPLREDFFPDHHLVNVLQRINHLNVRLSIIVNLKLMDENFEFTNLNQLTINQIITPIRIVVDEKLMMPMIFDNLTKLNIKNLSDFEFDLMSKFKFPKLESVSISKSKIPTSFIDQIKNIKSFECSYNDFNSSMIFPLSQLTNLTLNEIDLTDGQKLPKLYQCFDALSQHKQLKNIIFEIAGFNALINKEFIEKLINFSKQNSDTKIMFKIYRKRKSHVYKEHKKVFEEVKLPHKLNMKMFFKK